MIRTRRSSGRSQPARMDGRDGGGGRRADLHPRHCGERPQSGRDFQPEHLGRVPIFRVSETGRPRNEYGYRGVSPDQRGIGGDAAQPDARSHQHRVLLGDPMFPDGAGNVLLARGHPDGRIRRPADGRGRRRRPHGVARDLLGPESGICRHDSERAGHGSGCLCTNPDEATNETSNALFTCAAQEVPAVDL